MRLAAEILGAGGASENAHHRAQPGIGSCLKVEWCISDGYDLGDAIDPRRLHRVKEHKRGGPALCDIVAANRGDEVFLPVEPVENRGGDGSIETRCSGHEIAALTQFADSVFGSGNGWDRPVDRNNFPSEFFINTGREFFAAVTCRKRLPVHEMADHFTFGSSAPPVDLLRSRVDPVMRERPAQHFGDIPTILDDGPTDIENYQPDMWR